MGVALSRKSRRVSGHRPAYRCYSRQFRELQIVSPSEIPPDENEEGTGDAELTGPMLDQWFAYLI